MLPLRIHPVHQQVFKSGMIGHSRTAKRLMVVLFLVCGLLTACGSTTPTFKDLPPGDVSRGAALFNQTLNGAPPCANCHSLDGSVITGPSLKGVASIAGSRIPGLSAGEYLYQSIISPAAYILSGFSNEMYGQYGRELSPQQLADLIAYLLTLSQ